MFSEKQLTVTVNRNELLEIIKKNRSGHHLIVEEARKGYLVAAEKQLKDLLDDVKAGKFKPLFLNLELPQDHTDSYDTVIGMLEMSNQLSLEIQFSDYQKFVEDKWEWSQHFIHTNAAYSNTAASKKN